MTIEIIAIAYGDARYGRACATCNYLKSRINGNECGLHCLPTSLQKCCGTWCGDKVKPVEEKQVELW